MLVVVEWYGRAGRPQHSPKRADRVRVPRFETDLLDASPVGDGTLDVLSRKRTEPARLVTKLHGLAFYRNGDRIGTMKAADYFKKRRKAKQEKQEARIEALAEDRLSRRNRATTVFNKSIRPGQANRTAKELHELARREREQERTPVGDAAIVAGYEVEHEH